jgi:hypothetical protein
LGWHDEIIIWILRRNILRNSNLHIRILIHHVYNRLHVKLLLLLLLLLTLRSLLQDHILRGLNGLRLGSITYLISWVPTAIDLSLGHISHHHCLVLWRMYVNCLYRSLMNRLILLRLHRLKYLEGLNLLDLVHSWLRLLEVSIHRLLACKNDRLRGVVISGLNLILGLHLSSVLNHWPLSLVLSLS